MLVWLAVTLASDPAAAQTPSYSNTTTTSTLAPASAFAVACHVTVN